MLKQKIKVALPPTSNGLNYHATPSLPNSDGPHIPTKNMQRRVQSSLSKVFNNGGSSFSPSMNVMVDMSDMSTQGHVMSMPYTCNSNTALQQGIHGGMNRSEPRCSSCSPHMFGVDGNVLEANPIVSDTSAILFTNPESNSLYVNDTILNLPKTSNGFLGQMSNGNVLEASPTVGDASAMLFTNHESNSLCVNDTFLDLSNTCSNGFLGQMSNGNVLEASPTVGDASAMLFTNPEFNSLYVNDTFFDLPNTSSNGFLGQMSNGNVLEANPTISDASAMLLTNLKSTSLYVNDTFLDLPNTSSNVFLGQMSNGNFLEANPTVVDASATPFTYVEYNSHDVTEAVLDFPNTSSNGCLEQMSRKFSVPDVADLFPMGSDVLDIAFLDFDNDYFDERGEQG
ncbi:uncharacterized protein [Cicer arietinum]|uniref:uncharacterized protein isoform X2 n=1 Tax=Cicer arietinum TaxID=3827 RepID=UPI003CC69053